jgi:toxin secretion/phage lysis holin
MTIKSIICALLGTAGSVIASLFGGWNAAMTTLMIFMGLDYLTGIAVAGVFKKSNKSDGGGLESRAGWKGLIRKGVTLAVVLIAYRLDLLLGTRYIKDAVIIAFCANEVISLIENAGLMGVPIPETIKKAIELLKQNGDDEK